MRHVLHSRALLTGIFLAALLVLAGTAMAQAPGEVQAVSAQSWGDFYRFATRFWWLIFPVMSMVWGMIDLSARHRRARESMQVIKSYIDQGKEPPPELIKLLDTKSERRSGGRSGGRYSWTPVFLFAALGSAFLWAAYLLGMEFEPRQIWALHMVAMVFGALCLGCLVAAVRNERDRDGQ